MNLLELAQVLATTPDHPPRRSRVLYLVDDGDGPEPAGFADAVGDVATVLDQLDTEGADGLAVQVRVLVDGPEEDARPAAVVATRDGAFAVAVGGAGDGATQTLDRAPRPGDPDALQACWRLVVHTLAALDRSDAIPEPPDDPHPGAYLMAAWLAGVVEDAKVDASTLDRIEGLPTEAGLVDAIGLPAGLDGWDAVHEAATVRAPVAAGRLGRNGVAWEAHAILGEPGRHLGALADAGRVELADAIFAELTARGWARPIDDGTA